jgi:ribonuclease D
MTDAISQAIWVDSPDLLVEISKHFLSYPILAVDTESNSLHAYKERVCLIQFSTPETDYLIDPLALVDLSPLADVFDSPDIKKIFHAAEYDIICLKRDYGFSFQNIFDTMIAARVLGVREVGLNTLLQAEYGMEMDKHLQKANWGKRPLPEEYRAYAQMDTHYLFRLYVTLVERLKNKGLLDLAREDFERMTRICGGPTSTVEEQIWHVNGARELTSRQAAILLELLKWRENKAREMDRPPFKIISTEELVDIAFTQPGNNATLISRAHISERMADRFGTDLIHCVEIGQKRPPLRTPAYDKQDPTFRSRLERLKNLRKHLAGGLDVESDIVLPRDVLYQLAQNPPTGWQEFVERMQLYPWRLQHFGKDIYSAIFPTTDEGAK